MVRPSKKWRILPAQPDLRVKLGQELGLSPVVAQVLINRGISDAASAKCFLCGGVEAMGNPWLLRGMDRATARIKEAIISKQKITIYGDYDVDGATATAVLYRVLQRLGAVVEYYIPERQSEGYGLNDTALEALCASGTDLVITVDCGISAATEVAKMAGRLDIIITDHHQPPELLPDAYAIINPKQPDCDYPDKQLAGVGVAYKLCQALWQEMKDPAGVFTDYLDLVAVGTIADIVSLTGENRIMVKLGLAELAATANLGLRALITVCGVNSGAIDASRVGFVLAPRLNAAGRVSHAAVAVELLVTADAARAAELAADLNAENSQRQAVEKELLAAAEEMLADSDFSGRKVLVLANEDWHPGVIGIVASRLVERYYRPVVMISMKGGIGKGSCRSIAGFDMYRALEQCADLLIQYGGHQQAAGLSIAEDNIDRFRERLTKLATDWLTEDDYIPLLNIDSNVSLKEVNTAFIEQLVCLAPHGMGNPSPVFACEELAVTGIRPLGQEGRHHKLRVKQSGIDSEVMAWDMARLVEGLESSGCIDLAFVPEFNDWQGRRSIQLRARDLRSKQLLPDGLVLADARDTVDKIDYIVKLLQAGDNVLVYANDRRQAVGLANRLRRFAACTVYYSSMADCRRNRAKANWQAGRSQAMVTTDLFAGGRIAAHVVWYKPPLTREIFIRQCQNVAGSVQDLTMHFLFSKADLKQTTALIEAWFPERVGIGRVYLMLKTMAATAGEIKLTDAALVRICRQTHKMAINEVGIREALGVLVELGLVERCNTAHGRILYLRAEPAHKLDIAQSSVYQSCSKAREEFNLWSRELQQATVIELWKKTLPVY